MRSSGWRFTPCQCDRLCGTYGRAYSPPREEGWLRHQENFGAAHLSAADGVVAHESDSGVSVHPVRSNKEASRHFLFVASTPPREEHLSKLAFEQRNKEGGKRS